MRHFPFAVMLHRLHQAAASGFSVAWENVNVFTSSSIGAMVGEAGAFHFGPANLAGKVFNPLGKFFPHHTVFFSILFFQNPYQKKAL